MTDIYPRHAFGVVPGQPQPPMLVTRIFRRVIAAVRRGKAVPAAVCAAGAATTLLTPPDGMPVLRDRWTWEVQAEHDALSGAEIAALRVRKVLPRHDGQAIIDEQNHVTVRPVNGRYLGTLPRRTPAATLNRAPWETGSFTVPADVSLVPVYGQAPVARVQEAERLAQGLIA